MAAKYKFKTLMVSDELRTELTSFRDSFGEGVRVTDKEVAEALWAEADLDSVRTRLLETKATQAEARERNKIARLEAKLKEKLEALEASKAEAAEEVAESAAA